MTYGICSKHAIAMRSVELGPGKTVLECRECKREEQKRFEHLFGKTPPINLITGEVLFYGPQHRMRGIR